MTRLSKLRKRLGKLLRRRRGVRWGTGLAALAVALLWIPVAAFLVDWRLGMNRPQRVVAMAILAAVLVWVFRRFVRPWLGHRETELDMALLVQKEQHIDSDLVAALQFESPEAAGWGSVTLEQEVIRQTAQLGDRLEVMQGLSRKQLARRTVALVFTALVLAVCAWQFPNHLAAFVERFLLLSARHYPTRTTIESVRINGRPVELDKWRHPVVKCPFGQPVEFQVSCSGWPPVQGRARLENDRGLEADVQLNASDKMHRIFSGELQRLVDRATCRIYLGDAWTEPVRIEVVPLPTIDVELTVTPPDYATGEQASTVSTGLRQISVIEGSQVAVKVISDKPLREVTFSIDGKPYPMSAEHGSSAGNGPASWVLDSHGSPLECVLDPIRYEIQATDVDHLQPERPIRGAIRIKADLRPRIVASAVTEYVLPTAKPGVSFEAMDDYGLARISILPEVISADGQLQQREPIVIFESPAGELPPKEMQSRYQFDLAPLGLGKGDQLQIEVQAVDFRGLQTAGKTTESERLVFQVTDERGILAAMSETDRESANRLQTMIQRQIDVGEGQ